MSFLAHIAAHQAEPPRVLVADDHATTRDDVCRALTDGGMVVLAEAADAAPAVQFALETRPTSACSTSGCPAVGSLRPGRSRPVGRRRGS
jgi:PleD family two-component response regulator